MGARLEKALRGGRESLKATDPAKVPDAADPVRNPDAADPVKVPDAADAAKKPKAADAAKKFEVADDVKKLDDKKAAEKARLARRGRERLRTVYGEIYDPAADREDLPTPPPKTPEQIENLLKKVKKTAFLREIDEKRLRAALSHMTLEDVKAGRIIYKQKDPGHHFYIVEEGSFQAYEKPEDDESEALGDPKEKYDESNPCFGELALLYCEDRPFTVKAETAGKLWKIDRKLYTRVVVKMAYQRRQRHMKFMTKVPVLGTIHPYEKVRLCDAFEIKKFKKGDVIIKEGDAGDGMYWIEDGVVEVMKKSGDKTETLKTGDYFGEMALLLKQPRNATCTAKEDCEVVFLESEAFERLLGKCRDMLLRNPQKLKKICKQELGTEDPDSEVFRK